MTRGRGLVRERIDEAVNGGAVARATLNGEPIDITSTEFVSVR